MKKLSPSTKRKIQEGIWDVEEEILKLETLRQKWIEENEGDNQVNTRRERITIVI